MINKKRKKKKNNLPIILTVTSILILLMYSFYHNRYLNDLKIYFNNIKANIYDFLIIKKGNINADITLGINKELEDENNELRNLLNLDNESYNIITAIVIKRDINWYQTLTIDKGKKDNISINMAVTSSNGLIGKIIEVGEDYSTVLLITSNSNDSKTSVDIKGLENYYGILDSYDKENGLIVVKNVIKDSKISIGDKVYTNGLGGIIPSGIYIGDVADILYDDLDLSKIIKVTTDIKYDNIRYVNVIRR